jgi:hypothetical protein
MIRWFRQWAHRRRYLREGRALLMQAGEGTGSVLPAAIIERDGGCVVSGEEDPAKSESQEFVECGSHGRSEPAFVCQHLVAAKDAAPVGFHEADVNPAAREWGDRNGWCDQCDKIYAWEGCWNDVSEAFAGITMVCSHCFSYLRSRHGRTMRSIIG